MKPCDLPESIEAALKVTRGEKVPEHCFDYLLSLDQATADLYFTPQLPLKSYSEPTSRSILVYEVGCKVETLINHEERLTDEGRRAARAVYAHAADECLKLLGTIASTEPYGSLRLTARFCKALHDELKVLVREYEAVS